MIFSYYGRIAFGGSVDTSSFPDVVGSVSLNRESSVYDLASLSFRYSFISETDSFSFFGATMTHSYESMTYEVTYSTSTPRITMVSLTPTLVVH